MKTKQHKIDHENVARIVRFILHGDLPTGAREYNLGMAVCNASIGDFHEYLQALAVIAYQCRELVRLDAVDRAFDAERRVLVPVPVPRKKASQLADPANRQSTGDTDEDQFDLFDQAAARSA